MKRSIYAKFIVSYIALAIVILVVVATLGPFLLEKRLAKNTARVLYNEANEIATSDAAILFFSSGSEKNLAPSVKLLSAYQSSNIWILDDKGALLIATDRQVTPGTPVMIDGFDAASFGPQYYEIGSFYNCYPEDTMHVMLPVTSGMRLRGYVAIHKSMSDIYAERDSLTSVLFILAIVFIALSFVFLLQFTVSVYRPLRRIQEGALAYGSGDLHYRIRVNSNDEIGYLAESMNLMAEDIEKANEYQRKFIANVSHDFRSPLTSIKGFTEAMIDGTIPPEMHEKYLRIIGQEADRLENMTQQILKMNTIDIDEAVLKKTDFDINVVIRDLAALFEDPCRRKRITLDIVLTGETLFVNADMEKIKQVLYNLLDNAIKFSDRNSSIKIETEEKYDKCYISVKDSGCGISKADLSQIWNRFYKSDSSRGKDKRGSGLGLSIVKEIIKAHGQNINVVSTEGVGTEFVFTLAISEEPDEA